MARDLQDNLYGENGFVERLEVYIAGEMEAPHDTPRGPHVLRAWFTSPLENGRRPVFDDDGLAIAELVSAQTLADVLQRKIAEVYGWDPSGTLWVSLSRPGEASNPPIRMERKCVSAEMADEAPSTTFLKQALAREINRNGEMYAIQAELMAQVTGSLANMTQHVATLATARASASAGADMSSPWAMVGLGVLVFAYPGVKAALGLPDDADLVQTAMRVRAFLMNVSERAQKERPTPWAAPPVPQLDAPPGAAAPPAEDAPSTEDAPTEGPAVPGTIDGVSPELARWMIETAQKLATDPAAQAAIVDKALKAGIEPTTLLAVQSHLSPK